MSPTNLVIAAAAAYFLSDGISRVGLLQGKAAEGVKTVAGLFQVACAGFAVFAVVKDLL